MARSTATCGSPSRACCAAPSTAARPGESSGPATHDGDFAASVVSSTITVKRGDELGQRWLKGARLTPEKLTDVENLVKAHKNGLLDGSNIVAGFFAQVTVREEFRELHKQWLERAEKSKRPVYLQEDPRVAVSGGKAAAFEAGREYKLSNGKKVKNLKFDSSALRCLF